MKSEAEKSDQRGIDERARKLFFVMQSIAFCESSDLINRIRTFTESDALHDKEKLSSALVDASLIAFLGFGFHPQNLKLLALSPIQQLRKAKVLATVVGVE